MPWVSIFLISSATAIKLVMRRNPKIIYRFLKMRSNRTQVKLYQSSAKTQKYLEASRDRREFDEDEKAWLMEAKNILNEFTRKDLYRRLDQCQPAFLSERDTYRFIEGLIDEGKIPDPPIRQPIIEEKIIDWWLEGNTLYDEGSQYQDNNDKKKYEIFEPYMYQLYVFDLEIRSDHKDLIYFYQSAKYVAAFEEFRSLPDVKKRRWIDEYTCINSSGPSGIEAAPEEYQ